MEEIKILARDGNDEKTAEGHKYGIKKMKKKTPMQ